MRKINTADIFLAARAVRDSGLRGELQEFIKDIADGNVTVDAENIGIDTILQVIEIFSDARCERAIYEVLAGPFEVAPEAIPVMEIGTLLDNLEYLARDGGLADFFRRLSGILGRT